MTNSFSGKNRIKEKMIQKCVYCRQDLQDKRAIDVCDKCGVGVWGPRMFNTILQGMNDANAKGDLGIEHALPEDQN